MTFRRSQSKRSYALQLGGRFLLLNMLRMRYPRPSDPSRPLSVKELEGTNILKLLLKDPVHDREIPAFLFKTPNKLSDEDKALLRQEFYKFFNMLPPALVRWSKDVRVKDGCAAKEMTIARTRQRLRDLAVLKVIAKPDGTNWTNRLYATAQECVFVFRNLYHPRRVDYVNWAILRNFGLDWERPTEYAGRRSLPMRVRIATQLSLRKRQIAGKPKIRKQV